MKIRSGFVSNSSSSSFVLDKDMLSDEQIEMLKNHCHYGKKFYNLMKSDKYLATALGIEYADGVDPYELSAEDHYDPWNVEETDSKIELSTYLDNFNMELFIKIIRAGDAVI